MEAALSADGLKFIVCKTEENVRHREILPIDWICWKTSISFFDTSSASKAGHFSPTWMKRKNCKGTKDVGCRSKRPRRIRNGALSQSGGAIAHAGHGFPVHATTASRHIAARRAQNVFQKLGLLYD